MLFGQLLVEVVQHLAKLHFADVILIVAPADFLQRFRQLLASLGYLFLGEGRPASLGLRPGGRL